MIDNEASLTWLDVKPVNTQVHNPTFFLLQLFHFFFSKFSHRLRRIWPTLEIPLEDQTSRTGRALRVKKTMQKRMKTPFGSATEAVDNFLFSFAVR